MQRVLILQVLAPVQVRMHSSSLGPPPPLHDSHAWSACLTAAVIDLKRLHSRKGFQAPPQETAPGGFSPASSTCRCSKIGGRSMGHRGGALLASLLGLVIAAMPVLAQDTQQRQDSQD